MDAGREGAAVEIAHRDGRRNPHSPARHGCPMRSCPSWTPPIEGAERSLVRPSGLEASRFTGTMRCTSVHWSIDSGGPDPASPPARIPGMISSRARAPAEVRFRAGSNRPRTVPILLGTSATSSGIPEAWQSHGLEEPPVPGIISTVAPSAPTCMRPTTKRTPVSGYLSTVKPAARRHVVHIRER